MVCKGSKEPKIKQLHLLILGFQKSYLFCLLYNIVSPLMMPRLDSNHTLCVSHTWRINSCKHGCWIMKINSIIKTKTSVSKLYNYLSTLSIINQPLCCMHRGDMRNKCLRFCSSTEQIFHLTLTTLYQHLQCIKIDESNWKQSQITKTKDQSARGKQI